MVPLRYNVRSLLRRRVAFVMTMTGIGVVVAVFVAMLALVAGLKGTLAGTGDPRNIVVIRRGTLSEATSAIPRDAFRAWAQLPGVVAASPEAIVIWGVTSSDGKMRMVPFRGTTEASYTLHPVRIVEGRRPDPGEALIGKALVGKVPGLAVGQSFRWGRRAWTAVGVFEAGGSAFESEVWGDVEEVLEDDRRTDYSAATLQAQDASLVPGLITSLETDPRWSVTAWREPAYYEAQSGSADPILALSLAVAFLMGVASIFGAINTMQASLAARRKEIAVLRALGFSTPAIAVSFMIEALLQTLPGGALGCLAAAAVNGREASMLNMMSFGSVGFRLQISPAVVAAGMTFAALIGIVAGAWPALSAARLPIAQELKG